MTDSVSNPAGVTVEELVGWLLGLEFFDQDGEPYEVWVTTGPGLSSPVRSVMRLNEGDVILTDREEIPSRENP